jgi:DNA-binding transcriptional ArsR family regulator
MDADLLAALKALSDASRLRIVGLLAGGRRLSVEELAAALSLTPATVVHHLRRLRDAGLVTAHPRPPYVEHELRLDRLAALGAALDRIGRADSEPGATLPGPDGRPRPAFDAKVLRTFLVEGRLVRIPAQERKRQVILRFLAETDFEPGRDYPEKEVNQRLALRHPDVASLRRALVDGRYLSRAGGIYHVRDASDRATSAPGGPAPEEPAPGVPSPGASPPRARTRRPELDRRLL